MTSATSAAQVPVPLSRDEAGRLLGRTMILVALTAGFFALGSYIGRDTSGGWAWLWFITAFAALLALNAAATRSEQFAVGLLFAFGVLLGLAVAPTVGSYAGADPQEVWEAGRHRSDEPPPRSCASSSVMGVEPRAGVGVGCRRPPPRRV
jgi:hypothetical protein